MIDSFVCVDVILLLIIPRGFLGVGKKCKGGGGGRQVLSSLGFFFIIGGQQIYFM